MTNGGGAGGRPSVDTHYEFFPSVRRGLRPSRTYDPTSPSLSGRNQFPVSLRVQGKTKDSGEWEDPDTQPSLSMRLYGPGDVSGIDKQQVARVEPEPGTTTFPPNYFPLVEFAKPDLPWLFSPERANPDESGRVRPWLCLVVVKRASDEVSVEADGTRPLPSLTAPAAQLPPLSESWAWAHTQVVGRLSHEELTAVFTSESNQAVSRLLCPRNLDPNTRYLAAVVPTFEPGRRAGLGKAPFDTGGSGSSQLTVAPAWSGDESSVTLPIYHQWEFTTSSRGDFEALARELSPRNLADHDVGVREVDMSDPGPVSLAAGEGLTRKIGGALKSPGLDPPPYPKTADGSDAEKRLALRNLLNDPESTDESTSLPTVGPPIYGQWYLPGRSGSTTASGRPTPAEVPVEGSPSFDSWLHDLNVEPRHRIAAGYGTEVIQENQEAFMEAAWEQFGSLKQANRDAGRSQLGAATGDRLRTRFEGLGDEVVGFASRIRDHEGLKRRLAAVDGVNVEDSFEGTEDFDGAGRSGDRFGRSLTSQFSGDELEGIDATSGGGKRGPLAGESTDFRGDGMGAVTRSQSELSQTESLTSGSFRRLTRAGGKLDRGLEGGTGQLFSEALADPVTHDSRQRLGSRFAAGRGADEETPTADRQSVAEPSGPGLDAVAEDSIVSRSQSATWRLDDAGNVLSLPTAIDRLDPPLVAVPKALVAVESVRDHVDAARSPLRRLRDLLSELDSTQPASSGGPPREQIRSDASALVASEPTVAQRCDAIRQNTFDVLDRAVSKLVAADTDAVSASLTHDRVDTMLERCVSAHDRLVSSATDAADRVRQTVVATDQRATAQALQESLSAVETALSSLDEIESVLTEIESQVAPGTAGATGPSESVPGPQPKQTTGSAEATPRGRALDAELGPVRTAMLDGADGLPGALDAGGWTRKRASWRLSSAMTSRTYPLAKIMAAPEFDRPMYEPLADRSQQYLLPGVDEIPKNTIGALETNRAFVESYMAGLNHEMGRELLWRRYPTDRRGTYFRQFWDYVGEDDHDDITKLHTWGANALGENYPGNDTDDRVVLVIRGDLLRAYPSTRIYAVKAVKEQTGDGWDRVPLLSQLRERAIRERERGVRETLTAYDKSTLARDAWDPRDPIFEGRLDPDITFLGFDLTTAQAAGQQLPETPSKTDRQLGWFFVLEERVGECRFGLDTPADGDYGVVPYGLEHGAQGDRAVKQMPESEYDQGTEAGWSALSWGHLVDSDGDLDSKAHVSVGDDNPAGGNGQPWSITVPEGGGQRWTESSAPRETWDAADEATWGKNSAHMARITWQQPARVCIHADDILPSLSGTSAAGQQRYVFPAGDGL